jgi:hypothetical protein
VPATAAHVAVFPRTVTVMSFFHVDSITEFVRQHNEVGRSRRDRRWNCR